jgi:hypothetical protein
MHRTTLKTALALLALVLFASPVAPARAQDGVVITSPESGTGATGVVEIRGTAVRQPFLRYELAFAYDPNPRGTWFAIGEPGTAPVVDGVLGRWDTANVADGVYELRLRVYSTERDFGEFFVGRVVVRHDLPTAEPTIVVETAPATTPLPGSGIGGDPTPTAIALPPPATSVAVLGGLGGPNPVASALPSLAGGRLEMAFMDGIRLTAVAFVIMGAYAGVRWLWRRRRWK